MTQDFATAAKPAQILPDSPGGSSRTSAGIVAACENFLKSFGALGEGTVEFVAVRCGPNPIRLTVFFQKAKRLRLRKGGNIGRFPENFPLFGIRAVKNRRICYNPYICLSETRDRRLTRAGLVKS